MSFTITQTWLIGTGEITVQVSSEAFEYAGLDWKDYVGSIQLFSSMKSIICKRMPERVKYWDGNQECIL
jgi:hypothetical protein